MDLPSTEIIADDLGWAERSNYWLQFTPGKYHRRIPKPDYRQPIILAGHGVRISVDKGTLLLRNGFTHYPQRRETWRLFAGGWRLPSRIVLIDVDGGITFDAIAWLAQHEVPLIQINWRGELINIVSADRELIIPEERRAQLQARNKDGGIAFGTELIRKKIANSADTLRRAFKRTAAIDQAIEELENKNRQLWHNPPRTIPQLLGIEGKAAWTYFGVWRTCEMKWKGTNKHPIPENWHYLGWRTSEYETVRSSNRNATHPINAMLNYAYAVLESQVFMAITAFGLDPTIGILHGNSGKQGLVYDLMEPHRPIVDLKVLDFVRKRTFHRADFTIRSDGVCRLNPELARQVVRAVMSKDKPTVLRQM